MADEGHLAVRFSESEPDINGIDSLGSMTQIQIETERLLLRRWKLEDIAPYSEICADPDVMRWIGSGGTQTPEQAAAAIDWFEKEWMRDGYGLFAVVSKQTGKFVGFTGLSRPDFLPAALC
jgi:RimJ/RimL family protein N-acetyltransferase